MCGRYSLTSPVEAMAGLFLFDERPNLGPRFNIAPTQEVPVIRRTDAGQREIALMRWGLVPSWAKEIGGSANARGETVAEKPSFRSAFKKRRCLIPADGFYEWKKLESGQKQPYRIALPDDAPFGFAGIWEQWQSAQGDMLESCAIITTLASDRIADIHPRMPVILPPDSFDDWLDAPRADLIGAYDGALRAYPIGTAVNKVVNDNPALWDEAEIERTAEQLDLL